MVWYLSNLDLLARSLVQLQGEILLKFLQNLIQNFQLYPKGNKFHTISNSNSFYIWNKYTWLEKFISHLSWKWLLCDYNVLYFRKVYLVKWRKFYFDKISFFYLILQSWFINKCNTLLMIILLREFIIFTFEKNTKKKRIKHVLLQWF